MALLLLAPSDPERGKLGASVATSITGQLAPPRSAPCATDTWCWDFRGRGGGLGRFGPRALLVEPRPPQCHQLSAPPEGPGGWQPSKSCLWCLGTLRQGDNVTGGSGAST